MENLEIYSELRKGDVLNNKELCEIFKCGPQGGMRKSNTTNSLVLVSDQTQSSNLNPYQDKWIDGILHYTGMGLKGDQDIDFRQNKTLVDLDKYKVKAYLFEKKEKNCYTFVGEVVLAGEYYKEEQEDSEGKSRLVIKFPLKVIS